MIVPLVQVLMALWAVFCTPKFGILALLKQDAPPANSVTGSAYVLSDHPAAATTTGGAAPAPSAGGPAAPPAPGTGPSGPTVKTLTQDVVRQPWTVWGLAALGLTFPLVISQLRAAGHEAASGTRGIYEEGRGMYRRVDNADDYTENRSRARRRR